MKLSKEKLDDISENGMRNEELLQALKLALPFLEHAVVIKESSIGDFYEGFGLENLQIVKSAISKAERKE